MRSHIKLPTPKNKKMKKLLLIITAGIVFSSCQKDKAPVKDELANIGNIHIPADLNASISRTLEEQYNTFYGPAVQFGEGHVRSWANISHDDKPLAVGIEFTAGCWISSMYMVIMKLMVARFVGIHQKS
jgi:hypothetical protein